MGYSKKESRRLLQQVESGHPGPYYLIGYTTDGLETMVEIPDGRAFCDIPDLYATFRNEFYRHGRCMIFASAGNPTDQDNSTVLGLDTAWVHRAIGVQGVG